MAKYPVIFDTAAQLRAAHEALVYFKTKREEGKVSSESGARVGTIENAIAAVRAGMLREGVLSK